MIYYNPSDVRSPRDCVDDVKVFFDGGHGQHPYSIAKVTWEGEPRIGIRWNINQREWDHPAKKAGSERCIGEPNSRGYPTWFILPSGLLRGLLEGHGEIADAVRAALDSLDEEINPNQEI